MSSDPPNASNTSRSSSRRLFTIVLDVDDGGNGSDDGFVGDVTGDSRLVTTDVGDNDDDLGNIRCTFSSR